VRSFAAAAFFLPRPGLEDHTVITGLFSAVRHRLIMAFRQGKEQAGLGIRHDLDHSYGGLWRGTASAGRGGMI
jgi:hypothetical protein